MNKKILRGSLAGVAVIALAAGGSTLAAWSDFTEIDNNAGAGVLKLNVDANTGSEFTFENVKMAPGIALQRNVYVASNAGDSTPSGKLFIRITDLKGTEDGCNGNAEVLSDPDCAVTSSGGEFTRDSLLQMTSYAVNKPGECNKDSAPKGKAVTGQHGGSLAKLSEELKWELTGDGTSIGGMDVSYLAPGQGLCVSMTLNLPYGASNASQGDSASFTTRFDLEQAPQGTKTTPIVPVTPTSPFAPIA